MDGEKEGNPPPVVNEVVENDLNDTPMWNVRMVAQTVVPPAITKPPIEAENWKIEGNFFTMFKDRLFCGLIDENPFDHTQYFNDICDIYKNKDVTEDAFKLRAFPFTLDGEAKAWLRNLPSDSIRSFQDLNEAFINHFFPPSKVERLRMEINGFTQRGDESLYDAWVHFKKLLRACPPHGLTKKEYINTFYRGTNFQTKQYLDSSSGGVFMYNSPNAAKKLLEDIAVNTYEWAPSPRDSTRKNVAQVESEDGQVTLASLNNQFQLYGKELKRIQQTLVAMQVGCQRCEGPHLTKNCPIVNQCTHIDLDDIPMNLEAHVNFVSNPNFQKGGTSNQGNNSFQSNNSYYNPNQKQVSFNTQSNTSPGFSNQNRNQGYNSNYNQNRQNNFQSHNQQNYNNQSYNHQSNPNYQGNQSYQNQVNSQTQNNQGYNQQPQQTQPNNQPSQSSKGLEELMQTYIKKVESTEAFLLKENEFLKQQLKQQQTSFQTLESTVGRLSSYVSERPQGTLPHNIQVNPNTYNNNHQQHQNQNNNTTRVIPIEGVEEPQPQTFITQEPLPSFIEEEIGVSNEKGKEKGDATGVNGNDAKGDNEKGKDKGKESSKGKYHEKTFFFIEEECNKILASRPRIPKNLGDPGKFVFPCKFGESEVFNALAGLGASINLKPHSLYERLGLGPLKPTKIRIRLANHSFDTAIGIAEDILVSIDSLVFPVDFVIMEMKEDLQVPLILGRPFLATSDTIILVQRNQLNIEVGDECVTINIREAMKQPSNTDDDECYALDHIDLYVNEELEKLLGVDTWGFDQVFESDIVDLEADFNELMNVSVDDNELEGETIREESFEAIPNEDRIRIKSSWEEPPTLELKELPEHLEYAFLKESGQLPVIISKRLTVD
ncbi:uncharacterized protein [Rutidosis leptorrhynchoides]|uniref:uncharacterized protein n=1 Tax=Rutidosis leptorrhynchoides TaxID=125765 RepID=UPI003A996587